MKRTDIFHNASLKLSFTYLLIIMLISSMFSVVVFRVSSDELARNINRAPSQAERRILFAQGIEASTTLAKERIEEFEESKQRLINRLLVVNLLILISGGGASYLLARKTLQPIEQAHESQSRFTADASHELRTPITAMRVETELTLTEPKLTLADAKRQLASNIEELDKLTSLSDGLLQLARMDVEELETTAVAVDHIIALAAERMLKTITSKKQTLKLPKTSGDIVKVHQNSAVEALVTLLDNASKYSPPKSPISVGLTPHKSTVDIVITDKGMGIKSTELPYIFDRFYRADASRTSNTDTHGYGIGLSIAKQAIEASGGTISVKSTLKKGSAFTVSLPK